MKRISILCILLLGVFLVAGCKSKEIPENSVSDNSQETTDSSILSEEEIIGTIPQEVKTIFVYEYSDRFSVGAKEFVLEIEDIEIEKRNTDEEYDTIYCTLHMNNDYYAAVSEVVLYYTYYEVGGWILDGSELINENIESLIGIEQDAIETEIASYYFDSWTFVESKYDVDTQTMQSIYEVDFSSANISYQGMVTITSCFISEYMNGRWEHSLQYLDKFDLDVIGMWAGDPSDLVTNDMIVGDGIEMNIISIDPNESTIEFDFIEYEVTSTTHGDRVESHMSDGIVLKAYEVMEQELEPPVMTFSFMINGQTCEVTIKSDSFGISSLATGQYSNGHLHKGYALSQKMTERGDVYFEKVIQ